MGPNDVKIKSGRSHQHRRGVGILGLRMPRWQKTRRSDPGAATLSLERRQGRSDFLLSDCTMLPAAYLRVSHEAVMEAADGSVLKD